jgi:two-component system, OmpR family, phosphate regulon sensor histidine kinase PhoR
MSSRTLFWIPVLVRLVLLLAAGCTGWVVWDFTRGLAIAFLILLALIFVQLRYMYHLSLWLDNPEGIKLQDGWGSWTDIFAKLYRLRRDDQKSRSELAEWLSRFREAMSQLPDGVVIMDDVLFLEWCNPVAERQLGLSLKSDKGMRVTNLIRSPEFIDYIILAHYEEPLTLNINGRKLIIRIIPFENRRQILVTHDMTEFDRLDQMRRDFIANASHELRTPLTVINGFLEIANLEPNLDVLSRQQHITLMVEQGKRMQNLIEDMLVLTRLESIDYPMRDEFVDIRHLLDEVLIEAKALSNNRHKLSLKCDGPDILGGTEELRSAFSNLVSNAIRYTPEGGEIMISWSKNIQGPAFSVKDNGIGIKQENLARLTERFYRVDKGRSRETQGTGLGLAIVKHVLMRHNARLLIESELGKGSVFTIQFPDSAAQGKVA